MKVIIANLGLIAAMLLWVGVISRGVARLFRVPVRKGFFWLNIHHQRLTRTQYVWTNGVLVFGMTMFLFRFGLELLRWTLEGRGGAAPTYEHMLYDLSLCVVGGLLFGFWSAPARPGRSPKVETRSDPRQ